MGTESLIVFLIVGVVAGFLAGQLVRGSGFGLIGDLVVGVIGAYIAGWLFPRLGISLGSEIITEIVDAVIGAVILALLVGGGVVAWHLAARNPERVTRAAILNAPHPATLRRYARAHPTQALKSWYVAFFQLPSLPERALGASGFWVLRRVLRRSSRPGTFTGDDFRHYRDAWAQPGALTAMLNWYRALRLRPAAPAPARIRVPIRVIWGDRDAFLDRGLAEAGAALCDNAEIIHLPDATHWLQHEEPGKVNRLLVEFLLPPASSGS